MKEVFKSNQAKEKTKDISKTKTTYYGNNLEINKQKGSESNITKSETKNSHSREVFNSFCSLTTCHSTNLNIKSL